MAVEEVCVNGLCMQTSEVEAKLDEGNIQEAESSLREGLALNSEEARALLGRLEYQRGNIEAALRVFEGIDLQAVISRFQQPVLEKPSSRRNRSRTESIHSGSQHAAASLVLEAIYLKSRCLQKLGRANDAANECKFVLDAVEKMFPQGIVEILVDNKLQEIVSKAIELLPELWKEAGCYQEAVVSYRRVLLGQWNLDSECCARIQKGFAVFLLYGGVEAGSPSLGAQIDGSFVPKNNIEEAILLLMVLLKNYYLGKIQWDPDIINNLTVALSLCGLTEVLATQYEEILPGTYTRSDHWKNLALCYKAAGKNMAALNLIRKCLNKSENADDVLALLFGSKICGEDTLLASEGTQYAKHILQVACGTQEHLKGLALWLLGTSLSQQAKVASSDFERTQLQSEALKSLDEAVSSEISNPDIKFDLGVQYAEHRNANRALQCAKEFIGATGGSLIKGYKFLALVYSALQQFSDAELAVDAALDETGKWDQGSLLRLKAKLKTSQTLHVDAIDTYRLLLALAQAQRKSSGPNRSMIQEENGIVSEFEVWQGLASLYASLSYWRDAEICLEKARAFDYYSASALHTEGTMYEARGLTLEAVAAYGNGLLMEPNHVPCKVSLGALLWRSGSRAMSVSRCLLSDALKLEPTNRSAWYYLGMIYKDDGRISDASDCFLAANILEDFDPVEITRTHF